MDFSDIDITKVLFSAIPERFQDFPPSDFEDFICQLYRDSGHTVEQTKYSGDFGADLILDRETDCTVVQIKRYAEKNKVGVQDVNQVIGSKEYYKAERCIVVTTSSFTPQAAKLCLKADVTMLAWEGLLELISDTYLDGLSYLSFYRTQLTENSLVDGAFEPPPAQVNSTIDSSLEIKIVLFGTGMRTAEKHSKNVCAIAVRVTNNSERNIHVDFYPPDYITPEGRQLQSLGHWEGEFADGVIYSGANVTPAFTFLEGSLPELRVGSKLVLKLSVNDEPVVRHFLDIESLDGIKTSREADPTTEPSGGMCFIATVLYGVDSPQYRELTFFRDNVLRRYLLGRLAIRLYYKVGPSIVSLISSHTAIRNPVSQLVKLAARLAEYINRSLQNTPMT